MSVELKNKKTIYVTQPLLPSLDKVGNMLNDIWESKWLTNMGEKHNLLEKNIKDTLKVKNLSLFNNGTIALLTALKALELEPESEVITTPFTFAATPHCISLCNLTPVFCDIEPDTMCIDVNKIESMITPKTSAILGVHVYGFPCDVEKIALIANKYNLKVIYDAAHAFSTEICGKGIGSFGDVTMFSFHATKLYNTIEGGAVSYNENDLGNKICSLRNFGIKNEDLIDDIGLNGKMNEIQAAIGLLNLELFNKEKEKRSIIKKFYDENLSKVKGIRLPIMPNNTTNSYQYYPIIIEDDYLLSRDELYNKFKKINIMTRKYFYPLCSDYECYKNNSSSSVNNLPIANQLKNKVLCLPFYGELSMDVCHEIYKVINENFEENM